MIAKVRNIEVYLWDNDPLQGRYNVGTYKVKGYIMPYELYEDVLNKARDREVYFPFSDILDAFVGAVLDGTGQAVDVDCSMFLQMEVINGD